MNNMDNMKQNIEQSLIDYNNKLQDYVSQLRDFKHDENNHWKIVRGLIANNDNEEAVRYIDNILGTLNSSSPSISTSNPVLDVLLSDKKQEAIRRGIDIHMAIAVSQKIGVENMDCCRLFSNALDNAMDACDRLKHSSKSIDMKLAQRGNVLSCVIVNPIDNEPLRDGNLLKTVKKDSINHGHGMGIMKDVIKKYNGEYNINFTDNTFEFSFSLFTA